MSTRIIAINGPNQCGKSTASRYIQHLLQGQGESCRALSFADPMYIMFSGVTGLPVAELKTTQWKNDWHQPWGCTGRELLIALGEGMRAELDQYVWIRHMMAAISTWHLHGHIVIDDLRKNIEADALRHHGAEVWHISRPGCEFSTDKLNRPVIRDPLDRVINNAGGLIRFKENLALALRSPRVPSGCGPAGPGPAEFTIDDPFLPEPPPAVKERIYEAEGFTLEKRDVPLDKAQEAKAALYNHDYTLEEGQGHD